MSVPVYVTRIVVACAILHNMAILNGLDLDIPEDEELENRDGENQIAEDNVGLRNQQLQRGLQAKERIVRTYFHRE